MTPVHSIEEARDRAALYALGALSEDEAREFEQHFAAECAVCAAEVQAFAAVVTELGRAVRPQQPPASVRSRVLERVATESWAQGAQVFDKEGLRFVRSAEMDWQPLGSEGIEFKTLFVDSKRGSHATLIRMAPGAVFTPHRHGDVEESYVLEGELLVSGVLMRPGDYCRAEPGSLHTGVTTRTGCIFIAVGALHNEWLTG